MPQTVDLGLVKGATGEQGPQGSTGPQGNPGFSVRVLAESYSVSKDQVLSIPKDQVSSYLTPSTNVTDGDNVIDSHGNVGVVAQSGDNYTVTYTTTIESSDFKDVQLQGEVLRQLINKDGSSAEGTIIGKFDASNPEGDNDSTVIIGNYISSLSSVEGDYTTVTSLGKSPYLYDTNIPLFSTILTNRDNTNQHSLIYSTQIGKDDQDEKLANPQLFESQLVVSSLSNNSTVEKIIALSPDDGSITSDTHLFDNTLHEEKHIFQGIETNVIEGQFVIQSYFGTDTHPIDDIYVSTLHYQTLDPAIPSIADEATAKSYLGY